MRGLALLLLIWNVVVFVIYGYDKWAARNGERRVRESTLIACAFGFGGVGALAAMKLFRHKTRKLVFTTLVPLSVLIGGVLTFLFVTR